MFKKNNILLSLLLFTSISLRPESIKHTYFPPQQKEKPKNDSYFCFSKKITFFSGLSVIISLLLLKKYKEELNNHKSDCPECIVLRTKEDQVIFVYRWLIRHQPTWSNILGYSNRKRKWDYFLKQVNHALQVEEGQT